LCSTSHTSQRETTTLVKVLRPRLEAAGNMRYLVAVAWARTATQMRL
jgi:hypothetical protein